MPSTFRRSFAQASWGLVLVLSGEAGAAVKLPAGTTVSLELQQNLTSAYTETNAPVYFRVEEDVSGGGHVLIRKGTLVTGRMVDEDSQRLLAQNGSVAFDVRYVPAVDGQNIRVIGTARRAHPNRAGVPVTGVILWGVFGPPIPGAYDWLQRGARVEADVLSDRMVQVDKEAPQPSTPTSAWHAQAKGHRFDFTAARVVDLNLAKSRKLDHVRFEFQPDPAMPLAGAVPLHWQAVELDGAPLPQPVDELVTDAKGIAFDSWALLQYCHEGDNVVGFRAILPDNARVDAQDTIAVHFTAKR